MKWDEVLGDTEFQAQPEDVKLRVAQGFFNEHIVSDPDFRAQPMDVQDTVLSNFLDTVRIGPKPAVPHYTGGNQPVQQPDNMGAGYFEQPAPSVQDIQKVKGTSTITSNDARMPLDSTPSMTAQDITRPFEAQTYEAAKGLNLGMESFTRRITDIGQSVGEKFGVPERSKLFNSIANTYKENAAYWEKRAKEVGPNVIDEIVGAAAGGAVPGVAEFALNVPYAAASGAAEAHKKGESEALGAIKEGSKRLLLGQIFEAAGILKQPYAAVASSGAFAAQTAAEGGSTEDIAKSAGVGLLYGAASPGGEVGPVEIRDSFGHNAKAKVAGDLNQEAFQQAAGELKKKGPTPAVSIKKEVIQNGSTEKAERQNANVRTENAGRQNAEGQEELLKSDAGIPTTGPSEGAAPEAAVNVENGDTAGNIAKNVDVITLPEKASIEKPIDMAAHEAATSPLNELPQPTEAQKEAGNYKKGHVDIQGLDISIENPKGSTRSGIDKNGDAWNTEMQSHYGYIKGTVGKDKDHIDTFIGPNPEGGRVYVVDQVDPATGKFDEHKIMIGYDSIARARQGYLENYQKDWQGIGSITPMSMGEFKTWLKEGDTKKPFNETKVPFSEKFSRTSAGAIDFGIIGEDVAQSINKPSAPIRLEQGDGKYGLVHIENDKLNRIKKAGYPDVAAFVEDVAKNYNQIWEQPNGRLMLVKRNGKAKLSIVELQQHEDGTYYGVTTAFIDTIDYPARGGRKLLWERGVHLLDRPEPSVPLASNVPLDAQENVRGASTATGQSNISSVSNLTPTGNAVKGQEGAVSIDLLTAGAKTFYEHDIKPKVKGALKGFEELVQRVTHALSPRTGVGKRGLDEIMRMKGERDKAEFILEKTTEHITKMFDKMSREDTIDFIDRIKRGEQQKTPELQAVASMMRRIDNELYNDIQKYKPSMPWKENHYRVLWKVVPGEEQGGGFNGLFRRPLQGSKGFMQKATLLDMSEGIDRGGVPYSYNPMVMFQLHYADAMKFITAQKMFEGMKEMGLVKFVRERGKAPEGFVRANDPMFQVYFKPEEGGMFTKTGEWYIDEGAGRLLNNYLSRDLIREVGAGRGLLWLKNTTTAIELSLSAFHATFESLESVGSSIGLGLSKLWNRGVLQGDLGAAASGLKDIASSLYSPRYNAKLGGAAIKYMTHEEFAGTPEGRWLAEKFPQAKQMLDDLFTGGGKLAMHQDYRINTIRTFKESFNEGNYIGATIRALPALNELLMKPLFEVYIPRLKVGMFLREYANELAQRAQAIESGKMTRAELARKTWNFVEDRLGEMNFDNLFWNRTFKSSMQLMFRSVTWKLGNLRATGGAIKGQAAEFMNAIKEGRAPELHSNMTWLLGMSVVTATMGTIVQYMNTGRPPESIKDLVFPQIDEKDKDVRISLPTYWKDLVHLYHSPGGYLASSLAGWIGKMVDIYRNKDFYNVEVRHPDDPLLKQGADVAKHMVPLPFSVQSAQKMKEKNEPLTKQASGLVGFTRAPGYIAQSKAEEAAGEFIRSHIPEGARTQEQFERSQLKAEFKKRYRDGEPVLKEAIAKVREGKLTRADVDDIRRAKHFTPLQEMVKRLTVEEALKVWDVAAPDEKKELKRVLLQKRDAILRMPGQQREAVLPKFKQAIRGNL